MFPLKLERGSNIHRSRGQFGVWTKTETYHSRTNGRTLLHQLKTRQLTQSLSNALTATAPLRKWLLLVEVLLLKLKSRVQTLLWLESNHEEAYPRLILHCLQTDATLWSEIVTQISCCWSLKRFGWKKEETEVCSCAWHKEGTSTCRSCLWDTSCISQDATRLLFSRATQRKQRGIASLNPKILTSFWCPQSTFVTSTQCHGKTVIKPGLFFPANVMQQGPPSVYWWCEIPHRTSKLPKFLLERSSSPDSIPVPAYRM